ncbi:MAG TPA: hypothetical protein PK325_15865 [Cyclobacteriaceae bacterium]|nr:hypothetical protein [Cyclobacteriaceae bacterium]HMV10071.1 hypothetical protein [Cyclobacteriaceae bacterium]HMV90913.1 hypothetical protein [Cyclobacteriaceae bacterium]HMW99842.1 hypothetical protein [Cyclobacteriaceae bacterium]HMX49295.1 hypothetical protein [Cyclobacteriaceae bacterium]
MKKLTSLLLTFGMIIVFSCDTESTVSPQKKHLSKKALSSILHGMPDYQQLINMRPDVDKALTKRLYFLNTRQFDELKSVVGKSNYEAMSLSEMVLFNSVFNIPEVQDYHKLLGNVIVELNNKYRFENSDFGALMESSRMNAKDANHSESIDPENICVRVGDEAYAAAFQTFWSLGYSLSDAVKEASMSRTWAIAGCWMTLAEQAKDKLPKN